MQSTMMKTTNEELISLLKQCGARNENALEILYKALSPFLNSYALRFVRCEALSNEVLQDSFVQIWENASCYCLERGKPLTWICSIVRHRAIDKLRAEKKHLRFSNPSQVRIEVDEIAGNSQPELEAVIEQSRLILHHQITELSANEQLSIKLAYLHDVSRTELAATLNTNVNTVKSWLHRGVKHLQQYEDVNPSH